MACQLYQQKCKICHVYAEPAYYDEEFTDIVTAVARKFDNPRVASIIRTKEGNPRGIHIECEACEMGIH